MIWMLSHRRPPEDLDDLVESQKEAFTAMIPIIGRPILAVSQGFEGGKIPVLGAAGDAANDLGKMISTGKINEGTLQALSLLLRIPYTGRKRFQKTVETGDPMELIGGKPRR